MRGDFGFQILHCRARKRLLLTVRGVRVEVRGYDNASSRVCRGVSRKHYFVGHKMNGKVISFASQEHQKVELVSFRQGKGLVVADILLDSCNPC